MPPGPLMPDPRAGTLSGSVTRSAPGPDPLPVLPDPRRAFQLSGGLRPTLLPDPFGEPLPVLLPDLFRGTFSRGPLPDLFRRPWPALVPWPLLGSLPDPRGTLSRSAGIPSRPAAGGPSRRPEDWKNQPEDRTACRAARRKAGKPPGKPKSMKMKEKSQKKRPAVPFLESSVVFCAFAFLRSIKTRATSRVYVKSDLPAVLMADPFPPALSAFSFHFEYPAGQVGQPFHLAFRHLVKTARLQLRAEPAVNTFRDAKRRKLRLHLPDYRYDLPPR